MKTKNIFIAFVLPLVLFTLLSSSAKAATCGEMGGQSCSVTEECSGSWLYADDVDFCCSGGCYSPEPYVPPYTPPYTPYVPTTTTTVVEYEYYTGCTPWTTRDRFCACSSQVAYYRCNMWGTGWDYIVENCPSGTTCSNGQCGGYYYPYYQPYYPCTAGYTGNYRCDGDWKQGEYRNSDCNTNWNNVEYCSYGCSNGQCMYAPRCSEGYLDNWRCSNDWTQREYQYSDCTRTWQNYEYCYEGCSDGSCEPEHRCTAQYFDSYRCDGNWKQQMYQNSDCSISWINQQYCSNGCINNYCYTTEPCSLRVSASTPDDVDLDDTIYSTVEVTNYGDQGGWIDFTAYVCRSDGNNCQRMDCDGYDPLAYVGGHDTSSFTCSRTADEESWHKIRVDYSGCQHVAIDPTIYSGRFEVSDRPRCTQGYEDNYRCSGSWKQQQYKYSDCRTEWKNIEYCSEGCSDGNCKVKPKESIPKVFLENEYEVGACKLNNINFDVMNAGDKADTFSISYSGGAAGWIDSVNSVYLDAGERETVKAYVSVPCSVSNLESFTVKVSNTQAISASSFFRVVGIKQYTGWFVWDGWMSDFVVWFLMFVLFLGLLLLLILLVIWALSGRNHRRRYGNGEPEGFNHYKAVNSRKAPESFTTRC